MRKTQKLKKRGGMIDFMRPLKDTKRQRDRELAKSRWKKLNAYIKSLDVLVDPSDDTRSKLWEIPLGGGKYTKKKKRRKNKKR